MNIALIFARGGSKGLPGKNIRMLGGKPLIAYSIEAATGSPLIEKVFVSTDSAEIGSISSDFGASVIPRPVELAGDTACLSEAHLHAFQHLIDRGVRIDKLICMMPTYPFKTSGDVTAILGLLEGPGLVVITWYNKIALPPFPHYRNTPHGEYSAVALSAGVDIDSSKPQDFFLLNHSMTSHSGIPAPYQRRLGIYREGNSARYGLNIVVDKVRSVDINEMADFEIAAKIIEDNSFDFSGSFADSPFESFSNQ